VWSSNAVTVAGTNGGFRDNSPADLYYPTDVFVDNSGAIYVADSSNNRVQRWFAGATTGTTVVNGSSGTGLNQFNDS
jgi:hypothetical protein